VLGGWALGARAVGVRALLVGGGCALAGLCFAAAPMGAGATPAGVAARSLRVAGATAAPPAAARDGNHVDPAAPAGSSGTGNAGGTGDTGAAGDRGAASRTGQDLEAFLRIAAVAGREQAAAAFIRGRLGRGLPVRSDALANVTVTFGSGRPRRLVACPLAEPGFVVSRVDGGGYLRLAAADPDSPAGAPWQRAAEGQAVWVGGSRGDIPGVVAARSLHLQPRGGPPAPSFTVADGFVDVGAEDAAQAAELGVRPLDPVTLERRPARLAGGLIAGPSARAKAACLAAAGAARRFRAAPGKGTVVFAWTAGDLARRAGIDRLLRERGPFSELVLLGGDPGWQRQGGQAQAAPPPAPAAPDRGLVAAGPLDGRLSGIHVVPYLAPRLRPDETAVYPARVTWLGVAARYPGTAVETVAVADLERLTSALLALLGSSAPARQARPSPRLSTPASSSSPALPVSAASSASPVPSVSAAVASPSASAAPRPSATASPAFPSSPTPASPISPGSGSLAAEPRHGETAASIGALVARYGVSGDEAAVRTAIAAQLPSWAHPVVDWAGNIAVTAGAPRGDSDPLLFMAHMDEIGFRVSEVLPDGRLKLQVRGGLYSSLWEGQAALVHGRRGPVPALFEPRPGWLGAGRGSPVADLTAFLGAGGPREVATLGVQAGAGVTMPKALLRLGRHRVTAGSLDDRAGAAVLLLALRRIDPSRLRRRVTFAWTTREETGFLGAAALAHGKGGYRRVYPVDACPTSDSPRESRRTAYVPLGRGAVLPAAAPGMLLARMRELGRRRGIALQVAAVPGGNDGIPFRDGDAAVAPLSWPCRYLHTPAEVADLRDLEALVDLVAALAGEAP
jgi:putative aminopeptidase